ncbi:unnamed protein product [Clavelina lepadiformis]|uniref:Uncharacterized protein n=1 Tax=Clavelina lepadiformis TaxID=159417 RepID=A0ABP0G9U2_CLALP
MDSILSHVVRRNSTVASETSATPTCPQVVDKMETCQEAAVSRPTQRPSLNAEKKLNKLPVRSSIPQAQPIRLVKPVPSQPGTSHITQQQPSPESSDSESSDSSSSDSSAATIPHPILLQRAAKMLTSEMNESKKRKNPSNISELEAKQQTLPAQAASRVEPASDTRPPPTSGMSTQESTPQSNSLCSTPVLDRGHKPGFTNNEMDGTRKLNAGTSLKLTKSKTTISPSGDPVSGLRRRSSGFASNGRSAFRLSQNLQRKRSFEVRPTGRSCGSNGASSGDDPAPPNNSWRRDRDYRNRRESLDCDKLKEVKTETSQHLMENEVISTRESFKAGCTKVKVKEENDGSCEVYRESPKSSEDLDEEDDLLQSTCWPPENYSEQLSQERSRELDSSSNSRCTRRKS